MVVLKAFFDEPSSLSVVNQFVYDQLVPKLEATSRPSEAVFHNICDFIAWMIEHGHTGEVIGLDVIVTLMDKYLSGLTSFLQGAPITQCEPTPSEFPFEEFTLSKSSYYLKSSSSRTLIFTLLFSP